MLTACLSCFDWQPGVLPRIKTAQQGNCVCDILSFHIDHRTGGRVFAWSRAIGDYGLVARQFIGMVKDFRVRNQLRARDVTGFV